MRQQAVRANAAAPHLRGRSVTGQSSRGWRAAATG